MTLSQMQYYKQQHGYSYDQLSQLTGIPKGTIQKIFTGVTKSPRYDTLQALERVLKPVNQDKPAGFADDEQAGLINQPDMVCGAAVPYG